MVTMRTERAVIVLLRAVGTLDLLALPLALMPFAWMDAIHRDLGLGTLPNQPIVGYLARCICLLYAANGALAWMLSSDVRRFAPVIGFEAVVVIILGACVLAVDWSVGMPNYWTALEGPTIAAIGAGLWILVRLARNDTAAAQDGAR